MFFGWIVERGSEEGKISWLPVAGRAGGDGPVAQAGGQAVEALLVPFHLAGRDPVPRAASFSAAWQFAHEPRGGRGAGGDVPDGADVVLPVAARAVGGVGHAAGQRRAVHAVLVQGVACRSGTSRRWRARSPRRWKRTGPCRSLMSCAPWQVTQLAAFSIPFSATARLWTLCEYIFAGPIPPLRGLLPPAIRSPWHRPHVAATFRKWTGEVLSDAGGRRAPRGSRRTSAELGTRFPPKARTWRLFAYTAAASAWHPEQFTRASDAVCGRPLMSAWQSVQERSPCTDALYASGSTWRDIPGNFPSRRGGFFGPPGTTLDARSCGRPLEDAVVPVAAVAFPVVQGQRGPGRRTRGSSRSSGASDRTRHAVIRKRWNASSPSFFPMSETSARKIVQMTNEHNKI